jgi:hypothetical protein
MSKISVQQMVTVKQKIINKRGRVNIAVQWYSIVKLPCSGPGGQGT